MAGRRIHDFKGTQNEYCRFLEQLVLDLKRKLYQAQIQLQSGPQRSIPVPCLPPSLPPSLPSSTFDFVLESPKPQPIEGWKTVVSPLLRDVPKSKKEWAARRTSVRLSKPEQLVQTFCFVTRLSSESAPLETGHSPDSAASILDVVKDYRSFAKELATNKTYMTQILNYATLLFVCLSVVARNAGAKPIDVDQQIKDFLKEQQGKCDGKLDYMGRLRKAALWPIKRMEELYRKGLKHRAWEIFLLCGPSIHSYKKFTDYQGTENFTDEVVICKPPEGELQADIPFSMPFLVKFIVGKRSSLDQINTALGTHLCQETFNAWVQLLWGRMQSMRKIRCLSQARKKRKVSQGGDEDDAYLTQDDRLTGILGEVDRDIDDEFQNRAGMPPDKNNEPRGASAYSSSGQYGGNEGTGHGVVQRAEQADFMDNNTLPSTYVVEFLHMDGENWEDLDSFGS